LEFVLNLFLDTLNKIIIFGLECCVMGDLKPIAKNRYGFFEDIKLDFVNKGQGKIICLTGTNGTGKTQILSHIESVKRKETIFSSTTINKELNKKGLEDFINELIKELNLKNHTELENALFAKDTAVYNEIRKGIPIYKLSEKNTFIINHLNTYVDIICSKIEYISNKTTANRFKNYFGELNEDDEWMIKIYYLYKHFYLKKKGLTKKISKNDKNKIHEPFHLNLKNNNKNEIQKLLDDYKDTDEYRDEYIKHSQNKKNNRKFKKNIFTTYESFIDKLHVEVFDGIDINNLIQDLGKKIIEDYKIKKEKETIWYKINEELKDNKESFLYKLVKPKITFNTYDLQFKYQGRELENQGVISFDYLSTGEKQIFTLIVYKYLFTIEVNKTKYKYLLLDEFDANLNPVLINFYVRTLKYIIEKNKNIRIIITTHSALTLKSLQREKLFDEEKAKLYEIKKDIKEKNHTIKPTEGKAELDTFICKYSDGLLLYNYSKIKEAEYIIIVEGKYDQDYIETYLNSKYNDKYYITKGLGATNLKTEFHRLIENINKDELNSKKIILLYDFDNKGYESFKNLINGENDTDDKFILKDQYLNLSHEKINQKNIVAMMHKPINASYFNKNLVDYPYSIAINDVVQKRNKKSVDFEIEDLIVAYNVDKYKEFLSVQNQKHLTIEKFFSIKRGEGQENPCHKKTVNNFFEKKHTDEDFNFAGFDELFKRIEANFNPASKNSQGVDDEK
jgi:5S rRNA maturation endonuclease (ribonuclease M5)/ABC-type branched-subunit amino acid transport system ATPase component